MREKLDWELKPATTGFVSHPYETIMEVVEDSIYQYEHDDSDEDPFTNRMDDEYGYTVIMMIREGHRPERWWHIRVKTLEEAERIRGSEIHNFKEKWGEEMALSFKFCRDNTTDNREQYRTRVPVDKTLNTFVEFEVRLVKMIE